MQASRYFLSFCFISFAPQVNAQALECQLLRNEILQIHSATLTDKCESEYKQCLQAAGGNSIRISVCAGQAAGCESARGVRGAFGDERSVKQALEQKLELYRAKCER